MLRSHERKTELLIIRQCRYCPWQINDRCQMLNYAKITRHLWGKLVELPPEECPLRKRSVLVYFTEGEDDTGGDYGSVEMREKLRKLNENTGE